MKKIYNLFLCTIIFSLCSLRAQDNSNNNVKNVPPHASSSNYYPWLIGASIIGTGAIARKHLYNKYKNEKLYQQSVEE